MTAYAPKFLMQNQTTNGGQSATSGGTSGGTLGGMHTANAQPQGNNTQSNTTAQAYLRTRVMTAPPEELRMMLLDGSAKFARQAREALDRKDFEGQYLGTTNCRNIVFELMTTIREEPNPELASQVKSLYAYIYKLLTEASLERDGGKYDKVIELLDYERDTWAMAIKQLVVERASGSTPSSMAPASATSSAQASAAPAVLPFSAPAATNLATSRAPLSIQG